MSGTFEITSPVAGLTTSISAALAAPFPPVSDCCSMVPAMAGSYRRRLVQRDALDAHLVERLVARVGRRALDLVDDVHAVGHAAEDGVLSVEPRSGVGGDDEELRAVGVRARVGHGERDAHDLVLVELVLELLARPAGAGPGRIPALNHEVLDDPVEDDAVVEAVGGELA